MMVAIRKKVGIPVLRSSRTASTASKFSGVPNGLGTFGFTLVLGGVGSGARVEGGSFSTLVDLNIS